MTKYISFPASKVASMIGMNQYAVFSEIFDEMKCKLTDNKYKTLNDEHILDDNELKVLSNILLPNIKLDSSELNIETILHKSCEPSIHSDNTTNIKKNEKKINTLIKKQFPDKNISKLSEYITTNINTKRGILHENNIIQKYNTKHNTTITNCNEKNYKYDLVEINKNDIIYKFYISGYIDGVDNNTLIEIKNRRSRLFKTIPEYECVQLEIYLRMLNLNKAKLIENFNDKFLEHIYKSDDELWDNIIDKLIDFAHQLLNDL